MPIEPEIIIFKCKKCGKKVGVSTTTVEVKDIVTGKAELHTYKPKPPICPFCEGEMIEVPE